MLSFLSDYTEGAHPKVLQNLAERNLVTLPGYGLDEDTERAKDKIRAFCGVEGLQIQFLAGGTQTNQVAISSMLGNCQGVIAVHSGHVNGHEAGAIEYSGHKVLTIPAEKGKLSAGALEAYMRAFLSDESREHLVQPGMVYISWPTELGTLYSKKELAELCACCKAYSMPLYIDGARLSYGLASPENDLSPRDICELCDLFYIGGTKCGALCGEALVFTHGNMPAHFLALVKQRGALLAKTRVVSQQFDALFTEGLYLDIGRRAVELALELRTAFAHKGYEPYLDSPTNQQFFIMDRAAVERLRKDAAFTLWEWLDGDRAVVRFVTGWATRAEDVAALKALL